ncbi:DUF6119 family protein [Vibrio parahaemolyticus]|uniref:DUF6119 family protein n=2 Tax=Vibrio parahaemolyticus TaxID=670 RepID=UPI001E443381|nr:DUF6119 family protein [Vibrio parahaemolyticus]ELB2136851.1 TIGR04141 family sporadically distributed protein [Vibrio parahaemolyticus]MCQ9048487.1 TIGR04141 family sporadically distributed protein [Vibrio parahaemolyticus]
MLIELGQVSFYLAKPKNTMDSVLDFEKILPVSDNFQIRDFKVQDVDIRFYCMLSESSSGNPPWLDFINQKLDGKTIQYPSYSKRPSGLLLFKIGTDILAAAFGSKGTSLLERKKFLPDFGIKTAMNMCGNTELRQTKSSTHTATTKSIDRQLSKPSDSFYFGLDDAEFLRYISANLSNNKNITLQGKDNLTVKLIKDDKFSWDKLIRYSKKFITKYRSDSYKKLFPNYPNFKSVNEDLELELNDKLSEQLMNRDFNNKHLAIPEFIPNDEYSFSYSNKKKQDNDIFSHIDIEHLGNECKLKNYDVDYLSKRYIYAYSHSEDKILGYKRWSVLDCIVAELEHEGCYFILNEGVWKEVSRDFYDSVCDFISKCIDTVDIDEKYHNICISNGKQNREEVFNEKYCGVNKNTIKFDQAKLKIGTGRRDNEFCDILQLENNLMEIIHVKKDGGSHSLSYLFTQSRFYCEFFLSDKNFISDIRDYIDNYEGVGDDVKSKYLEYIKNEPADIIGRDYAVRLWVLYSRRKKKPELEKLPLMTKYELKLAYEKLRNVHKYNSVTISFVPVNTVNHKTTCNMKND